MDKSGGEETRVKGGVRSVGGESWILGVYRLFIPIAFTQPLPAWGAIKLRSLSPSCSVFMAHKTDIVVPFV